MPMTLSDLLGEYDRLRAEAFTHASIDARLGTLAQWACLLDGIRASYAVRLHEPLRGANGFLPQEPTILLKPDRQVALLLPPDSCSGALLYLPLFVDTQQTVGGALFVAGEDPAMIEKRNSGELRFLSSRLTEILTAGEPPGGHQKSTAPPQQNHDFASIVDGLGLPFYYVDGEGNFLSASSAFLQLLGFSSLEELQIAGDVYVDPTVRREELEIAAAWGRIQNFSLSLRSRTGDELSVRDSIMLMGGNFAGVAREVTERIKLDRELQDSLLVQQLLNDQLLSSASVLQKTQSITIQSLARLAEFRDQETGDHLKRMAEYSTLIASEVHRRQPYGFRVSDQYAQDIGVSSILHDIGKVCVPDTVLLKPGSLNDKEWVVMKKHTEWGWEVLQQADRELGEQSFLTLATQVALHHHERFDGTGYPRGLAGDDIPLSARIVALADVYDALTSRRPYKDPWSHERARELIRSEGGRQFCPVLTELFCDLEQDILSIRRGLPE